MNSPPRKQAEAGLFKDVWREFNRMIDYVREISPLNGLGIQTNRTANGTTFNLKPTEPADPGSVVRQYRLKEVFDDYLRCRSWNGTTEGGEDVFIALPWRLRRTPFDGQTLVFTSDGETYSASYVYESPTKRTKTIAGVPEIQVILPQFQVDFDLIYAIEVVEPLGITTEDDATITLLDINDDGRAWGRKHVQS